MALRLVSTAPKTDNYTPLAEHQTETPTTFFGGKPVLYAQHTSLTLSIPRSKLQVNAAIAKFHISNSSSEGSEDGPADQAEDALVKNVEIWVNSDDLIFFQTSPNPTGISIPYPSIALHATMKYQNRVDALYMNLTLNDPNQLADFDDIEILEVTILPPDFTTTTTNESSAPSTEVQDIFQAMNACADLHPDPDNSDDDEGGEDEDNIPGAGGWITAENMHEFVDEDGNLNIPGGATVIGAEGELGPGAGTVRSREEEDGTNGANGVDGPSEETKWRKTD